VKPGDSGLGRKERLTSRVFEERDWNVLGISSRGRKGGAVRPRILNNLLGWTGKEGREILLPLKKTYGCGARPNKRVSNVYHSKQGRKHYATLVPVGWAPGAGNGSTCAEKLKN